MARFVSRFLNYNHGVQAPREMVLADGQRQILKPFITAQFIEAPRILTEAEVKVGIEGMVHEGLPLDNNTNQLVSPRHRLSGFDTEQAQKEQGWTDEERELVEKTLRASDRNGIDFIELSPEAVGKPWANYEETPVAKIAGLVRDLGLTYTEVLAYEKQTLNRDSVILILQDGVDVEATQEAEATPVVIEA